MLGPTSAEVLWQRNRRVDFQKSSARFQLLSDKMLLWPIKHKKVLNPGRLLSTDLTMAETTGNRHSLDFGI